MPMRTAVLVTNPRCLNYTDHLLSLSYLAQREPAALAL